MTDETTTQTSTSGNRRKRVVAGIAAVTMALPLSVAAVAPASAATLAAAKRGGAVHLVDSYPYGYTSPYGYFSPFGFYYGGQSYGGQSYASPTATSDTRDATASESRGLVEITSTIDFGSGKAMGTGMVLGSNGIVVTNHHVIADSTHIQVKVVSTGQTYVARVVGYDAKRDIAVLKLRGASGLDTITTDTSLSVDQSIVSVGDANGDGGSLTASPGTVTHLRRSITVSDEQGGSSRLRHEIVLDADIISGDSGGALLDGNGNVVGMNVAASSGVTPVTGYAIPIARVLRVATAILDGSSAGARTLGYSPFLGVSLNGTTVVGVGPGTAADRAGITAGSTVTWIDGQRVAAASGLKGAIAAHNVGDSVRVVWTDAAGITHIARIELGRAPVS